MAGSCSSPWRRRTVGVLVAAALAVIVLAVHASDAPAGTAVYMRTSSGVLDLSWDPAPSNLLEQLQGLGLRPLAVSTDPADTLRSLPERSAFVVPAQNGHMLYAEAENMAAVADFVAAGNLVVLLDANDDGEATARFVAGALRYTGDWLLCKRVASSERNAVSASTLAGQHAKLVLDAKDAAGLPTELEAARVTNVHSWCLHEDLAAVSTPLYTVAGDGSMSTVQVFGKAGVSGAVVWLGYTWRDGAQAHWAQMLHTLIASFAAGAYVTPSEGNANMHPLGNHAADSPLGFDVAINNVLSSTSDMSESAAEILRRFLADGTPATYPPTSSPSPSPSPSSACKACERCLGVMLPVVKASASTADNVARASIFEEACLADSTLNSYSCADIATSIAQGQANLAIRAGMLCTQLGVCSSDLGCSDLTVNSLSGSSLTGALDLCAIEGVVGGALSTPQIAPPVDSCSEDGECTAEPGDVCDLGDGSSQICQCSAGLDVCTNFGSCTTYCSASTTLETIGSTNAGSTTCDPDSTDEQCGEGEACQAITSCQRWQCNTTSQSLEQVPCSGLCMPLELSLVSAQLSDDGRTVAVKLNAYALPHTLVSCGTIFTPASTVLLGGEAALCNVSEKVLTARLGSSATLMVGQQLSVLPSGSALVGQLDADVTFTGEVTVLACASCVSPTAVVRGPSVVAEPCASSNPLLAAPQPSFDASLSTDPSGRALWADVRWSLPLGYGNDASRTVLQGAVDRANAATSASDRLRLSLTSAEVTALDDLPEYRLEVKLTSWLGTYAVGVTSFAKAAYALAPVVGVLGAETQTFRIRSGLTVFATVESVCAGKALRWGWASPSGWAAVTTVNTSMQQLYVPGPVPATHGQRIVLRVTTSYADDVTNTASADVTFVAVGSKPLARLTGPDGDVTSDTPIVLDATASTDPDAASASAQRLSYTWECRRDDYPVPCFTSAAQGDRNSKPGVWSIPAGLLANDHVYVFTVTVSKEVATGASSLSSTAAIRFRPRAPAVPFPRGTLVRQCAAAACAAPHEIDSDLVVRLTLDAGFPGAAVTWLSPEVPVVTGLTAVTATASGSVPAGTHVLTIPAALLPTARSSLTIAATMTLNDVSGQAFITVPLNSAPSCGLAGTGDASACLSVTALNNTFPSAAVTVRAVGWTDSQDSELRYEFGVRTTQGSRTVDRLQRLSTETSATLVGLAQGSVTLYACAIDSQNLRTCGTAGVTINAPTAGFDAVSAAASINVTALAQVNDIVPILQAGALLATLFEAAITTSTPENAAAMANVVDQQSVAIISAVLGGMDLADPEQARYAISIVSSVAGSAASVLSDNAKQLLVQAASAAAASMPADASMEFVSQLCLLLGVSMPTATGSANAGHRRSLAADASAGDGARQRILDLVTIGSRIGTTLGNQAVPGGSSIVAGDQGVYVAAAALLAPQASAGATASLQLTAGPDAITTSTAGGHRHRALQAATTGAGAQASLLLTGTAASGAAGYGLGLQYAPAAATALALALAGSLPASVTLLSGLSTISWNPAAGAAASAPAVDGADGYLQLRIPVTGFDATKTTACLSYDPNTNAATGALPGVAASAAPATFISYGTATGLVTCRVTATGSYLVAQFQTPPVDVAVGTVAPVTLPPLGVSNPTSAPTTTLGTTESPVSSAPLETPKPESGREAGASTGPNVGTILGAVFGGLFAAALVALLVLFILRRKRRRSEVVGVVTQPDVTIVTYGAHTGATAQQTAPTTEGPSLNVPENAAAQEADRPRRAVRYQLSDDGDHEHPPQLSPATAAELAMAAASVGSVTTHGHRVILPPLASRAASTTDQGTLSRRRILPPIQAHHDSDDDDHDDHGDPLAVHLSRRSRWNVLPPLEGVAPTPPVNPSGGGNAASLRPASAGAPSSNSSDPNTGSSSDPARPSSAGSRIQQNQVAPEPGARAVAEGRTQLSSRPTSAAGRPPSARSLRNNRIMPAPGPCVAWGTPIMHALVTGARPPQAAARALPSNRIAPEPSTRSDEHV